KKYIVLLLLQEILPSTPRAARAASITLRMAHLGLRSAQVNASQPGQDTMHGGILIDLTTGPGNERDSGSCSEPGARDRWRCDTVACLCPRTKSLKLLDEGH
ncbi:hypothetical protein FB451DRAFT_1265894, partial [Mycena latifolia]